MRISITKHTLGDSGSCALTHNVTVPIIQGMRAQRQEGVRVVLNGSGAGADIWKLVGKNKNRVDERTCCKRKIIHTITIRECFIPLHFNKWIYEQHKDKTIYFSWRKCAWDCSTATLRDEYDSWWTGVCRSNLTNEVLLIHDRELREREKKDGWIVGFMYVLWGLSRVWWCAELVPGEFMEQKHETEITNTWEPRSLCQTELWMMLAKRDTEKKTKRQCSQKQAEIFFLSVKNESRQKRLHHNTVPQHLIRWLISVI